MLSSTSNKTIFILVVTFIIKNIYSLRISDVSYIYGKEIKPQNVAICELYETSVNTIKVLRCFHRYYWVIFDNLPYRNYTQKTFCPFTPHFAVFFYNNETLPKNEITNYFNATVCKQKYLSTSSTTFKLFCKELLLKDINCEEIYDEKENPTNSSSTTIAPEINIQECRNWMCQMNLFMALFIIVVAILGSICLHFYLKFKEERLTRLKLEDKYRHQYAKIIDSENDVVQTPI